MTTTTTTTTTNKCSGKCMKPEASEVKTEQSIKLVLTLHQNDSVTNRET